MNEKPAQAATANAYVRHESCCAGLALAIVAADLDVDEEKTTVRLYRATSSNKLVRLSPEPIRSADIPSGCTIDEVDCVVPTVTGRVEIWQDDEGAARPHIHYVCPRCVLEHNIDLASDESSPRFACCDTCGWESVVWIEWDSK